MVEHDVQHHLEAICMKGVDHLLELTDLPAWGFVTRICCMWGEESEAAVTPVVQDAPPGKGRFGSEVMYRKKANARYAKVFEIAPR